MPALRILERLIGRHFPDKLDDSGKTVTKECVVCGPAERSMLGPLQPGQKRPKRCGHLTSFICKQCNVSLCVTPCFELFHTTLAYKRLRMSANRGTEELHCNYYPVILQVTIK